MIVDNEPLVFVWDNFGPMHVDRCEAVAKANPGRKVFGIEIFGKSKTYAWNTETGASFEKITLFPDGGWADTSTFALATRLVRTCRRLSANHIFLCDYQKLAILLASTFFRLSGKRVYALGCSKFDDYKRHIWRELGKSFFFLPYNGAISSGKRARDYIRFLGVKDDMIKTEYNTLSIERIKTMSGEEPAPGGRAFLERDFVIVARFVPKKNLSMAIDAYAQYRSGASHPRNLHLCGSGELEDDLRKKVTELGLEENVIFHGFLQTGDIARKLGTSLCLILPSIEEQFGNVVIEAMAVGLPVILSDNCGARDNLVKTGVNGFVIEPDNSAGLAFFMNLISADEDLWRRMSAASLARAVGGDVVRFVEAVEGLVGSKP